MRDPKCAAEPGCPNPGVTVELDCGPIGFEDVPICEVHLAQYQREGRAFSRLPSQPSTCKRCAALEGDVARLKTALAEASEIDRDALETSARRMTERDSARALLRELATAISEYRWNPSSNPQVLQKSADRLEEVLRRAEAEAGEEKPNG